MQADVFMPAINATKIFSKKKQPPFCKCILNAQKIRPLYDLYRIVCWKFSNSMLYQKLQQQRINWKISIYLIIVYETLPVHFKQMFNTQIIKFEVKAEFGCLMINIFQGLMKNDCKTLNVKEFEKPWSKWVTWFGYKHWKKIQKCR